VLRIVAEVVVPTVSARLALSFVESETLQAVRILTEAKNGQLIGRDVNGRPPPRAALSDSYFKFELTSIDKLIGVAYLGIILEYLRESVKPASQNPRTSSLIEFVR